MSLTLHTDVVLAALNMALAVRKPENVIHHSDQGSQYTSIAFGKRCREAGVRPSMGSVGDAYDNAMAESFFATLECELLERHRFKTQAEARMAVFAFIEGFYNPSRRHSALGHLSPKAFERQHAVIAKKRAGSSPGHPNHAAVLAPVKHKPCRARKLRVLDSACARRHSLRMGRDEGTGSAGAEPRNWIEKEDDTTPAAQLP
jgi:Integrase core domain